MTDIAISWSNETNSGDWSFAGGDLALGNPLVSAVMVSLFSDRTIDAATMPQGSASSVAAMFPAPTPVGGWWADAYNTRPIGSRLRQLQRAIKSDGQSLLDAAQQICAEALQWLLDDDYASTVQVVCAWASATIMTINVTIVQPSGASSLAFSWAWKGL